MPSRAVSNSPSWLDAGLPYHRYNFHLRQRFGRRVQRVSVNAGMTCPNVDGTVAEGGCVFCDNTSFSPSRRVPRQAIHEQIDDGIRRLKRRYKCDDFIAYFQPATNTYASVSRLRSVFEAAEEHEQVIGLAIGTRPDCVPPPVMELLTEIGRRTWLIVEYGMQTMHDRSLQWMNRGHGHAATIDAMQRSCNLPFETCLHIVLGLPGESREEMLATARETARLRPHAVKLHNLYAVRNTELGDQYQRGDIPLMGLDDYAAAVVDFLERLPPHVVVERISGEAPPSYFLGPSWCLDKPLVARRVAEEFERRGTRQGAKCQETKHE